MAKLLAFWVFVLISWLVWLPRLHPVSALSCAPSYPKVGIVESVTPQNSQALIALKDTRGLPVLQNTGPTNSIDIYSDMVSSYLQWHQNPDGGPLFGIDLTNQDWQANGVVVDGDFLPYVQLEPGDIVINGPPFHICHYGFVGIYTATGKLKYTLMDEDYADYTYQGAEIMVEPGSVVSCQDYYCQVKINFQLDSNSFSLAPSQSHIPLNSPVKKVTVVKASNYKQGTNPSQPPIFDWGFNFYSRYLLDFGTGSLPNPPPGCYYQEVVCIQAPCNPILVCPDSCEGDFSQDGKVGVKDLLVVISQFGSYSIQDLLKVLINWGKECPPSPASQCQLEPDAGPCEAAIPKYYYNQTSGQCEQFIWGGCGGVVPFDTLVACQSSCPILNPDLATACQAKGGTYLSALQECESINSAACTEWGGTYQECASPCRHHPDYPNIACPAVCVEVCSLSPIASCCSTSQKTQGYQCIQDCGPPVVSDPADPPTYSCLSPQDALNRQQFGCPICLSQETTIDTPQGSQLVTNLKVGDQVYSQDCYGKRIIVPLRVASKTKVPTNHSIIHLLTESGQELKVSPNHPLVGGKPVTSLQSGNTYQGTTITSIQEENYSYDYTYDILPDSPTGYYWANGILVDSSLAHPNQCLN